MVPRVLALTCVIVVGAVRVAAAQQIDSSEPVPTPSSFGFVLPSADQERELDRWLADMEKWQKYDEKFRNRPVKDGWARIVPRRPAPAAPEWLPPYCASAAKAGVFDLDERTGKVCRLADDPRAPMTGIPASQAALAAEKPVHSFFLTRLHLDGLWTTTQSGARLYGIVGSHMSLVDVGRLQVFGPPGVLLMSVPDEHGGRRAAIGYTWGISIRLADVRLGAPTKNVTLFLNVSKVWLGGGHETSGGRGFDIVGFSIAPRKSR